MLKRIANQISYLFPICSGFSHLSQQVYKWQISTNADGEEGPAAGGRSDPQLHSFRMGIPIFGTFKHAMVGGDSGNKTHVRCYQNNMHHGLHLC